MTLFCLFLPVALIAAWGGAVASAVQPAALGFLLSFAGMAGVLFWYDHQAMHPFVQETVTLYQRCYSPTLLAHPIA